MVGEREVLFAGQGERRWRTVTTLLQMVTSHPLHCGDVRSPQNMAVLTTEVLTTFRPEILETADRFYRVCAVLPRTADIWDGGWQGDFR